MKSGIAASVVNCILDCGTKTINIQNTCIESFGVTMDALLEILCWSDYIDDICKSRFTSEYYRRALATLELLMVKHGVLDVSGCHFSSCDIDTVLDFVCTA